MRIIKKINRFVTFFIKNIIYLLMSLVIRRKPTHIAIGSWVGERYADNSRYLIEYLDKEYKGYTLYWVGNDSIRDEVLRNTQNVVFLEKEKFSTNIKLLSCKFFFFSQMHSADISSFNVFRGAVMCYLHHGMPIKKWAADGLNQSVKETNIIRRIFSWFSAANKKYDYFVVSSEKHANTICSALRFRGCTMNKVLRTGTPRNDMFFFEDINLTNNLKENYCKTFGINNDKKIIMYLPTYRRISQDVFSFSELSEDERTKISDILNRHNAVIIEKSHCAEKTEFIHNDSDTIKFADKNTNIQEMMLFTDILISDYSGAYVDYILLDKPVIHFAYDYEYYKNTDSGLYYDISEFSAGKVAYRFQELIDEIDMLLSGKDCFTDKRKQVISCFMEYETGNASAQIAESVIGKIAEQR